MASCSCRAAASRLTCGWRVVVRGTPPPPPPPPPTTGYVQIRGSAARPPPRSPLRSRRRACGSMVCSTASTASRQSIRTFRRDLPCGNTGAQRDCPRHHPLCPGRSDRRRRQHSRLGGPMPAPERNTTADRRHDEVRCCRHGCDADKRLINGVVLHEMMHTLGFGTIWGPGYQDEVAIAERSGSAVPRSVRLRGVRRTRRGGRGERRAGREYRRFGDAGCALAGVGIP